MNNTMPSPSDQYWVQRPFYDQAIYVQPVISQGLSDATVVTSETVMGTNDSPTATNGCLTPKGTVSKPVRRRSRASKRTPTTLLNANTNNFRALVQQFTGCPSTAISFGNSKGPVNLEFGKVREGNQRIITPGMGPFGNNHQYRHQSQSPQQLIEYQGHQQQQQLLQEQQSTYSYGNFSSDVFVPTTSSNVPRQQVLEIADRFSLDDNMSLQELTMDSFSTDLVNDGFF
ncbi:hypothetical protein CJ030_MR0G006933 [Morella rubra]|uniref:VQ domain-containing protein n=1 Tax=Morella rubra TaxID=262757 RepID=A0A6A1UJZ9_9ROSI|nr:hypothetical protein CJ030_MR0G006933 [Morella rubra]